MILALAAAVKSSKNAVGIKEEASSVHLKRNEIHRGDVLNNLEHGIS
jgi:hypothetical protein